MTTSETRRGRRLRAACALAALLAAAVLSAMAMAAEPPTRVEYVSRLEAICRVRSEATQRALKGVRKDMQAERLKIAAEKFARGSKIFAATVTKISSVPRPAADSAKLQKWFGLLEDQESWLRKITGALRAGHGVQAQRDTARFIHSGNLANNVVIAFGFNYCSFRWSRYGG